MPTRAVREDVVNCIDDTNGFVKRSVVRGKVDRRAGSKELMETAWVRK